MSPFSEVVYPLLENNPRTWNERSLPLLRPNVGFCASFVLIDFVEFVECAILLSFGPYFVTELLNAFEFVLEEYHEIVENFVTPLMIPQIRDKSMELGATERDEHLSKIAVPHHLETHCQCEPRNADEGG